MKESMAPKPGLGQRLRSWIHRIGQLEESFLDDSRNEVRRIEALELELAALRAAAAPQSERQD